MDFNPRTHRGVRRRPCLIYVPPNIYFNPRTHRGVRPQVYSLEHHSRLFQSTHPSWGATSLVSIDGRLQTNFNPRTHRGVRR